MTALFRYGMSPIADGRVNTTWKYGTYVLENICAVMFCRHLCSAQNSGDIQDGPCACLTEHKFVRTIEPLVHPLKEVRRVQPAIQLPRSLSATSIGAAPGRTIALSPKLSGVR